MDKYYIYKPKYHNIMSGMVAGDIYELSVTFLGIDRELLYSVRSSDKCDSYYIVQATEFISINENRIQTIKSIINE